jgi:hypothetical protein
MAKQLPSIDTNADTFYSWIVKTNGLVNLCNTEVVTANNSANGATTTGVGYVIGTFGANTVVASELRGGNTIANGVLTVTSNTVFSANTNRFDSGVTVGANSISLSSGSRALIANTSAEVVVDTFPAANYRSGKYVISITDTFYSEYQATELLVIHNGNTTFATEYATLSSNSNLVTFRADISAGIVRLVASPQSAPLQINIARTLIAS